MARARVLVIDDSKFVRTTFRRILQSQFDVREEVDGESGWNAIASDQDVACVFCDITMPRMDGFGVLQRVRGSADPRIRRLPVVIISGDEDEATRKRARDSGANDFIAKTAEATEVLARIDGLMRTVRARQEAIVAQLAGAQSATHDARTGAFTLHYLLTEGRKHFSHARRHAGTLSVICFRIDNHARIVAEGGADFAESLLARIAKAVMGGLRTEDTLGRAGENVFAAVLPGTPGAAAVSFARRLHDKLGAARFEAGGRTSALQASIGIAALGSDTAGSIEDLLRVAAGRMQPAPPAAAPPAAATLPPEIERALQVLERLPAEPQGAVPEILRRLRLLLEALQKRLKKTP
jgi:diguanylate cyclase (GGDEF)-like protein